MHGRFDGASHARFRRWYRLAESEQCGDAAGGESAKIAPVGPPASRRKARYLENCAGSVCQLVPREEAFMESEDGPFGLASWSPDRRRRASLVSTTPPVDPRPAPELLTLRVFDASTGDSVDLLQVNRQHDEVPPVWSPDGTMIAFESSRGDLLSPSIDVVMADGSARWTVSGEGGGFTPAWSLVGRQLAFSGGPEQRNPDGSWTGVPTIVNLDGSGSRRLVEIGGRSPTFVGNDQVLFFRGGSGVMVAGGTEGATLRALTVDGAHVAPVGHPPVPVSPDRRCVAYLREATNFSAQPYRSDAYVVCLDAAERQITTSGNVVLLRWLTDGRLAVLGSGDCDGLLAVRIETDERECVVTDGPPLGALVRYERGGGTRVAGCQTPSQSTSRWSSVGAR